MRGRGMTDRDAYKRLQRQLTGWRWYFGIHIAVAVAWALYGLVVGLWWVIAYAGVVAALSALWLVWDWLARRRIDNARYVSRRDIWRASP